MQRALPNEPEPASNGQASNVTVSTIDPAPNLPANAQPPSEPVPKAARSRSEDCRRKFYKKPIELTEEEIRQAAIAIRDSWSPRELESRDYRNKRRWTPPTFDTRAIDLIRDQE